IASVAAASDPASWAGLATIDALPVHGGLSDTCAELCVNLQGYENDGSVDLVKGDIGLPYWAIGGTTDDLDTWLIRNGCDSSPFRVDDETDEFRRTTNVRSLLNEDADAFVVRRTDTSGYSKNQGSEINARLWDEFLSRHQRWMSLPGGDLRIAADPVKDLGMEYHDDYIDGWRREWYLHVPDQVKESSVPAPLVVALHGYTCTGEIYVGNSGWSRVADEYGFIVAFPTALAGNVDMKNDAIQPDFHPMPAWNIASNVPNGPDDVSFIEQIISQTAERWPVDESRIYATGHSWGSVMTHLLAAAIPDRFAAVAPCSGICFGGSLKNIGEQAAYNPPPLPIWMLWGTKEEWLISPLPKRGTETDETIRWWAHRNGVNPPDDLVSVMSPADVDIIGRTWWQNELENDYPVVRYTAVDGMPHATMPSMSRRIWTDFFSRIRRGKNGEITEI
ncbi:MAG: alpha/beta hydrolase family esterase, partial [Ancrocorticia sp.]|uniref:alpha/beta hydrolase family esterase n=1 Tax=Ancrocorticia sp. TaxID=2593684 RepID=UPI003F912074